MEFTMFEMRIHGYGGQGAVTLGEMIASAALKAGFNSQTLPFFGVERRGAPVKAAVRISREDIRVRSQSFEPDCLLVLNSKLLDEAIAAGIKENGSIWLNSNQKAELPYPVKYIDATRIAIDNGLMAEETPYINIPFFGAVCQGLGLPKAVIEEVILAKWPGEIGAKNVLAALQAYNIWAGDKGGNYDC